MSVGHLNGETDMKNNPVYGYVTERIIAQLQAGTVPWKQPWFGSALAPRNLVSKKPYRGINVLLLGGYSTPWFVSPKQCKERGGHIRPKEKANIAVFFKMLPSRDIDAKTGQPKTFPLLRYYSVFNVTQCEGLSYPQPETNPNPVPPIERCETIWTNWADRPAVSTGNKACYGLMSDSITMPDRQQFINPEAYYATLFHEGVHATGHKSRLARDMDGSFGSGSYAREELVAEIGAAMICGTAGIETKTIDNSAAYIASWLTRLQNDDKLVVQAAGKAQAAADYILGVSQAAETAETESEAVAD